MLLTGVERAALRERGVIVFEKCDKCGKPILESYCWKFAGKPEVFCSQLCRDGVARTPGKCQWYQAPLQGKKRGAKFCDGKCRKRFVRDPRKVEDMPKIADSRLVESMSYEAQK